MLCRSYGHPETIHPVDPIKSNSWIPYPELDSGTTGPTACARRPEILQAVRGILKIVRTQITGSLLIPANEEERSSGRFCSSFPLRHFFSSGRRDPDCRCVNLQSLKECHHPVTPHRARLHRGAESTDSQSCHEAKPSRVPLKHVLCGIANEHDAKRSTARCDQAL
jgi:hypothetical protein